MEKKKEQARREREIQARMFKEEQRKNVFPTNTGLFSEPVKKVPDSYQPNTSICVKAVSGGEVR